MIIIWIAVSYIIFNNFKWNSSLVRSGSTSISGVSTPRQALPVQASSSQTLSSTVGLSLSTGTTPTKMARSSVSPTRTSATPKFYTNSAKTPRKGKSPPSTSIPPWTSKRKISCSNILTSNNLNIFSTRRPRVWAPSSNATSSRSTTVRVILLTRHDQSGLVPRILCALKNDQHPFDDGP